MSFKCPISEYTGFNHLRSVVYTLAAFLLLGSAELLAQSGIQERRYILGHPEEELPALSYLLFDNVPTLFISNSEITLSEEHAQKLICDAGSLALLHQPNEAFRTVKLLQIRVETAEDLAKVKLNAEQLGHFKNLSFVVINSQVNLNPDSLSGMLEGFEEGDISFLYQVTASL